MNALPKQCRSILPAAAACLLLLAPDRLTDLSVTIGLFIGAIGACGLLPAGGEVDDFLVNKMTDIEEAKIGKLCEDLKVIETSSAEEVAQFIWEKLEKIVAQA